MRGVMQSQRTTAKDGQAAALPQGGSGIKSQDGARTDTLAQTLNQAPRLQPLLQLRSALDQSPRVRSQLVLQRALNGEDKAPVQGAAAQSWILPTTALRPATVQRYMTTATDASLPAGAKVSQHGLLYLRNAVELFAAPAKFNEANAIGGEIEFKAGAPLGVAKWPDLHRVLPVPKAGTGFDKKTKAYDASEEGDEREQIMEKAQGPLLIALTEKLEEAFIAKWNAEEEVRAKAAGTKPGTAERQKDYHKIYDGFEKEAEAIFAREGGLDKTDVGHRIAEYFRAQEVLKDRPLMYSDCHDMAQTVAGFAPSKGVATNEVAAGNVYEYLPRDREAAQWEAHYAAIIMTDLPDHVTMENAAGKEREGFSKQTFDRTWFFEMYGPARGQSFAEKYAADMGD